MDSQATVRIARRSSMLYAVVFLFGCVVIIRLFYLQVIRHDYYSQAALAEQESKFSIPAHRGQIFGLDGDIETPLVLNEVLPTVFVDPVGIDDESNAELAQELSEILSLEYSEVLERLEVDDSRYEVIQHRTSHEQAKQLKEADLDGVGLTDRSYRVYPQKQLAAQILGFVNGENAGQYGVEQYLDEQLNGESGRLKAITDVYGIPLSNNEDNVLQSPVDGIDVTLTIDINIQRHVEEALERGVAQSKSRSGSAIVIDPHTGAIKAMANYPSFDPANFGEVEDLSVFSNGVVSAPYETGSGVKVFTMAIGLDEGVVTPLSTYLDQGFVQVDDRRIENAGVLPSNVTRTMQEVIQNSVNTGVVHVLEQVGGGEINQQARETLHRYFANEFGLASPTGVEQANEAGGVLFGPNDGDGLNVRYANMTFGQGMTVTMLQMVAGVSSVINGGKYYQPHVVHSTNNQGASHITEPRVLRTGVVSEQTSQEMINMMQRVVELGGGFSAKRSGYLVGGKTGTSQVIDEETGEYSETREIGSFIGFGGSDRPEYVIMTKVDEPQIPGYAGTVGAAPIFADISNWLIDYYQLPPR